MVSHPGRGSRRPAVLFRWLSMRLAACRRAVGRASDLYAGERSAHRPGERLRRAERSGLLDGPLIAAVVVVGVAMALVTTLF